MLHEVIQMVRILQNKYILVKFFDERHRPSQGHDHRRDLPVPIEGRMYV